MSEQNKHGGKREGAGRKPTESTKQRVSYRLSPQVVERIEQEAKTYKIPKSRLVEGILRKELLLDYSQTIIK